MLASHPVLTLGRQEPRGAPSGEAETYSLGPSRCTSTSGSVGSGNRCRAVWATAGLFNLTMAIFVFNLIMKIYDENTTIMEELEGVVGRDAVAPGPASRKVARQAMADEHAQKGRRSAVRFQTVSCGNRG